MAVAVEGGPALRDQVGGNHTEVADVLVQLREVDALIASTRWRSFANASRVVEVASARSRCLAAQWDAKRCVHGVERPDAQAEKRCDDGG
jgi:hypothetical protein